MNARKALHDLTTVAAVGFTFAAFLFMAATGSEAEALPTLFLAGGSLALWAVAIACSAAHLDRLVYGEGLGEPAPIGVACRLCHRPKCIARSAPPMGRDIVPARFRESGVPFDFSME